MRVLFGYMFLIVLGLLAPWSLSFAQEDLDVLEERLVNLSQEFVIRSAKDHQIKKYDGTEFILDEAITNFDLEMYKSIAIDNLPEGDLVEVYENAVVALNFPNAVKGNDAISWLEKCATSSNPLYSYKCSTFLASHYHLLHNNTLSIQWAEKAVKQTAEIPADHPKYWYARFQSYELLFMAFSVNRDVSKAIEAGEQYLVAMDEVGMDTGYFHSVNNLSSLARKEFGPEIALKVTETVEPFVDELSLEDREISYYALARNYLENGQLDVSKTYFQKLSEINERQDVRMASSALSAYLYAKLGEQAKSQSFIETVRTEFPNSLESEFGAYVLMAEKENALSQGQLALALDIDRELDRLTKILFDNEISADRARVSGSLQVTNERLQREQQKAEYQAVLNAQRARSQSIISMVSMAAALFLLGLLYYIFLSYRREQKLNAEIRNKNEDLAQSNARLNKTFDELKVAHKRALAGMDAKEKFIGVVGHELRTPLNPIINLASVLEQKIDDRQDRALLRAIKNAGKRLHIIVENMLAISSNDDHARIYIEPIDVVENVKTIIKEFSSEINNRNVELKQQGEFLKVAVHRDKDVDNAYLSNRVIFRAIVRNIFDNSLKFTRGGEIKIGLSRLKSEAGFGLTIQDTGAGMDANQLAKLFNAFEQADMSLTRNHEGAGLGLAVVMKYCQQLGARVDIKSKVNVGTRISIEFPEPAFEPETGELLQAA